MKNQYVIAFLFWPGVVLVCALLNMLFTWTFSWSELIFDYFIGVLAGWFLFAGTEKDPHAVNSFFLFFSHGMFGLLWWVSSAFRAAFSTPEMFFWTMAIVRIVATIWCAAWDHLSVHLECKLEPGPFFFSFLLLPVKASFAWITSGFGFLIWIAGAFNAKFGDGKAGLAGGLFFDEFSPGGTKGSKATTLGFTVHTWIGNMPFKHELYHSRQYIYMSDWLVPFWCAGILWGLISSAISDTKVSPFKADKTKEVGNPIEVAAYHI